MHYKTRLQIKLDLKTDPFARLEGLKKKGVVLRANIESANSIVVYYDNRQVTREEILSITEGEMINENKEELLLFEIEQMARRARKHKCYNPVLNVTS